MMVKNKSGGGASMTTTRRKRRIGGSSSSLIPFPMWAKIVIMIMISYLLTVFAFLIWSLQQPDHQPGQQPPLPHSTSEISHHVNSPETPEKEEQQQYKDPLLDNQPKQEKNTNDRKQQVPPPPPTQQQPKQPSTQSTKNKQHPPDTQTKLPVQSKAITKNEPLPFRLDIKLAEDHLKRHGPSQIRKVITAFLEPPMNDTVPGTGSQGDINEKSDPGMPPQFIFPLPLRTHSPQTLTRVEYPKFQSCHSDLPRHLPVDRGLELDPKTGNPIISNVGNLPTPDPFSPRVLKYCPVDADPFLPWIHDVFPSTDGKVLEFIAHNKRRCKTGKLFRDDLKRLEPQVALLQSVSVERISDQRANELAPELWNPETLSEESTSKRHEYRYRLAPYSESAPDGQETRFICRFYATEFSSSAAPKSILIDEVLSIYPYNYEYVSYRKGKPTMLTPKGKDNQYFWTSVLRFQCPIPETLQSLVKSGAAILSDGTPLLHIDLIPIRTPPRFGTDQIYLTESMIGPKSNWGMFEPNFHGWRNISEPAPGFDANKAWGHRHVLPHVQASGRWTNLPICQPPQFPATETTLVEKGDSNEKEQIDKQKQQASLLYQHAKVPESISSKPHFLSACLWASASFKTRGGKKNPIQDTGTRLREWIEFHLMVGFDHIYVYDNSAAHSNTTSLAPILDEYPKSQISRIDWPSIVCNNNIPAHDNTGERSSQYTAENSCRTRHAPFTEWIASFDTDEYMIPMGEYTSLRDVLMDAQKKKANILSFRSSRARLRFDKSYDVNGNEKAMMSNYTFLEAYSCDSSPIPKPEWAERARKQIYRADYVPYHYVHYSTVTNGYLKQYKDMPRRWRRHYNERPPSERHSDEANEATLLHTKTTTAEQTSRWRKRCRFDFAKKWRGCFVGFPWPGGVENVTANHREDGMEYNCFEQPKIIDYWIPRLKEALANRRKQQRRQR